MMAGSSAWPMADVLLRTCVNIGIPLGRRDAGDVQGTGGRLARPGRPSPRKNGATNLCFRSLPWLRLPAEEKSTGVIVLADYIVRHLDPDGHDGSLFWVSDWGMWNPEQSEAGYALYRKFLPGGVRMIDDPGLLFGGDELGELAGCLSIPIFWGWDSCLVPSHGRYFVFHSNDEFIDIVASSEEEMGRLSERLAAWSQRRLGS